MTPSEEIRRATDKLLHVNTYVELWVEVDDQWTDDHADLKHEIAALIRAASFDGDRCYICMGTKLVPETTGDWRLVENIQHTHDCALLALVRAINGKEQP